MALAFTQVLGTLLQGGRMPRRGKPAWEILLAVCVSQAHLGQVNHPDSITRLNSALQGRYRIEHEIGEGGMATV